MNVRIKLGVVAASVAALALSACGSSSLSGETRRRQPPRRSRSARTPTLPAKLPESIKNAGVIKIGVDASYAPNEFLAGDGKTVQGMRRRPLQRGRRQVRGQDRVAAGRLRLIITGVKGKKYDIGISSFTINPSA